MDPEQLARIQAGQRAYKDSFKALTTEPFDFGRALPRAAFPADFVAFYTGPHGSAIEMQEDGNWFLADDGAGPQKFMFDGLFNPEDMTAQNGIISESAYAPAGSVILPPHHYVIGTAFGQDEMRLLINLEQGSADYGAILLWRLAYDPYGCGDNMAGVIPVAEDIQTFFAGLAPEAQL